MTGVVCTPLSWEYAALRGRLSVPLIRSGRGPERSLPDAAVGRPVLVAGVAGALDPGLAPGDLVVADRLLSDSAADGPVRRCPSAPLLAAALGRLGLPARTGALVSSPRLVDGAARRRLADRSGALAVDTETAYLAEAATTAVAAVRAIVDTDRAPLAGPSTVGHGVTALRRLRQAAPAIEQWARAAGEREILLASPRSFCAGVERAIEIVERALQQYGPPVYVRRQIVHNTHVVRTLQDRGAVFVEEVDEVPPGSVTVLAAHGVAPSVRDAAQQRGLRVVDATCPLVTKVHNEVRRFAARDSTIILIGHPDHEEVIGTRGEAADRVIVVGDPDEARRVQVADPGRVAYVMQTTLAADEAMRTAEVLRDRFPDLAGPRRDDICYATTNRQRAIRAIARESDLVLVVGSQNSSNSHRLVEVAEAEGARARLVDDVTDVDLRWLPGVRRVGITAGASAPPAVVDELVDALGGLGATSVRETVAVEEDVRFTLPREVS